MKFDNAKLLVICQSYNRFQKGQIDELSRYLAYSHVLVRYNPLAKLLIYIPVSVLDKSKFASKIDLMDKPSNIKVYPTPILYGPFDSQYKKLGEKHFKVVEKVIKKKGIVFDLIHAHFTWSAGYVGAKLKEKYRVPVIVTAHGYDIYDLPFKDEEWREKIGYVLNAADFIITVSNSNLDCIKNLNVKTPVKVIPNGFRGDWFHSRDSNECRKTLNLPLDKKIILTIGSLAEIKGHKYLIDAMKEVVKQKKNTLCIIVGDGKLKNKLKKQIRKAGLENYVKLVGGKPHNEIPIWMNACDAFVLPSLRESFGIVQIEAMACGKPVVATYNGGSEEIITSEDYGFLVEPANPEELAEKILIALHKEWDSEKIRKYAEQFRWVDIAKEIVKVYRKLRGDCE